MNARGRLRFLTAVVVVGLASVACVSQTGEVSVDITSPGEGDSLRAGEPIPVEIDLKGAELGVATSEGVGHLHIRVDDGAMQMIDTEEGEVTLEEGAHEITVEYTGENHESFDPPVMDSVKVQAR